MRKSATAIKTVMKNWLVGSEAIPVTQGNCPALGCTGSNVLALKTSVNLELTLYFKPFFPILILSASLIFSFLIYYLNLSKKRYFEGAELCSVVHLLYPTLTHHSSILDQGSLVHSRQKGKKIASAEEVTNFLWSEKVLSRHERLWVVFALSIFHRHLQVCSIFTDFLQPQTDLIPSGLQVDKVQTLFHILHSNFL